MIINSSNLKKKKKDKIEQYNEENYYQSWGIY